MSLALPILPSVAAHIAGAAYDGPWHWTGAAGVRVMRTTIDKFTVAAFEGTTKDGAQILRDMRFFPWWERYGGFGPAGFVRGALSVMEAMIFCLAEAAKAGTVIFVGHSLGGAMALRAAARFAGLGHPAAAAYALDPPRAGLWKLRRALRTTPTFISHDGEEIVPDLPFGYLHPGDVTPCGARRYRDPVLNLVNHRVARIELDLRAKGL